MVDVLDDASVVAPHTVIDIPESLIPKKCSKTERVYNTVILVRCNQPVCLFLTTILCAFAGLIGMIIYTSILTANEP